MIEASKLADLRTYQAQQPRQATSVEQKKEQLREATQAFEGLFLQQVMKTARETKLGEDLFGNSGVETMQGMLDEKLSQIGSQSSGLGIGAALYKQFVTHIPGASDE